MSRRAVAVLYKTISGKSPPLLSSKPHFGISHNFSSFSLKRTTVHPCFKINNVFTPNNISQLQFLSLQCTRFAVEKPEEKKIEDETKTKENEKSKDEEVPMEKLSIFKRFKAMYRDYWYVLVPVHIVTSIGWFGGFYYLAESGVNLAAIAETLNFSDSIIDKLREHGKSTTGYLAVSYLLYKIATPLRYAVTLGGTTLTINHCKRTGWIKPMPKKEEIRKILNSKKESFIERKETVKQNLQKLRERKS